MKMKHIINLRWRILVLLLLVAVAPAKAQVVTVLYTFSGAADGATPYSGLIMDSSGNLYGTTTNGGGSANCSYAGCGTVFELVNSSGTYTEKALYSFTNASGDGAHPYGGLIMDSAGNLYGTTGQGGSYGCGTVFELVKSSSGYTETILHTFTSAGGDGANPSAGLIMDSAGNLYGTTLAGGGTPTYGIVFELVKSSSGYTESVLHTFTGRGDGLDSTAGLIMDSAGNLYGTTDSGGASGYGTVFELVKSSGYTETILYSFTNLNGDGANPWVGLIMDSAGNLYGTTRWGGGSANCSNGCGTVFELVNSSGTYTEKVLYSFTNASGDGADPIAGLVMDSAGNVYGTTWEGGASNYGTVFQLVKSSSGYTETLLHTFTGTGGDGAGPQAGLIIDSGGNLYGTTTQGGTSQYGTVFELALPPAATTTTLTSSKNPAGSDDTVSFTAAVSCVMSCSGTPTGTVAFSSGATALGTQTLSSGQAALTIASADSLGIGTFTITAQYTPDTSAFASSSNTLLQIVNLPGVALTGSGNTFLGNQTVNGVLTATSFVGNGSGLTGIVAQTANTATSALTANYAATAGIASTAGSLGATPTPCGTNSFAQGIAANGNAICAQPASSNLSDVGNLVFNMQANTFAGGKQTLAPATANYASLNLPSSTVPPPAKPTVGDLWQTPDPKDSHVMFVDKNGATQSLAFVSDVATANTNILSADNSFTGSNSFTQPINASIIGNAGTVSNGVYTTGSYADPSWLTSLSGGKITGTVASATTALTAGAATTAVTATTANNAIDLGGVPANDYARLDIGNSFIGNQAVTGNITLSGSETVGGSVSVTGNQTISGNSATTGTTTIGKAGTPIVEHLSQTFTVSVPAISPKNCAALSPITFTGASDGDTIALGVHNALVAGTSGVVLQYFAWVNAANTVSIDVCNPHGATSNTAVSGAIRVDIWKH